MGIFPEFGGWISQNTQQPKKSENVKSKPVRETKTHDERDEMKEQLKLWRDANKKEQYHEPSPTVKVHTDHNIDSFSSIEMEFTLGLPPQAAYDVLTNQDSKTYSREINGRPLLTYNWKRRKGMDYMETFEVNYTVEPMYVDAERLCKHKKPKSREEYRKCSGGKGLIASKVKVDQNFRPSFPWNLPLLSSYFRRFTVETTKKVAEDFQTRAGDIRHRL